MQNNACQSCQQPFPIETEDLEFLDAISPVVGGKKYAIPAPRYCPACRTRRRMAYRNEQSLYKRECSKCSKLMLSVYSQDKKFTVWCRDCWWEDDWNGTDFGQEFDFNRPFFEQYYELLQKVPQLGIINAMDQNCDFSNYGYGNKDCYLLFTSDFNEKCFYGCFVWSSFECFDNLFLVESQLCYECVDCMKCYNSAYCRESESLTDCWGCYDCRNCRNCFGSSALRNKEYYFFNDPLSKENYEQKVAEAKANWEGTLQRFKTVGQDTPRRNLHLVQCENVLGDHLKNSKNAKFCFDCIGIEDCKYVTNIPAQEKKNCFGNNSYDIDGGGFLAWSYECISTAGNQQLFSDHHWTNGSDLTYCSYSMNSNNCFGCVGVRKGEYCILNKQYSKKEYELMLGRVIEHMQKTGEWGECFMPRYSRYSYNETVAQTYFPLSRDEAVALGYSWRESDNKNNEKAFRLTRQEQEFYTKMGLPAPRKHPELRMKAREELRNPRKLRQTNCDSCKMEMFTTYPADFPGKVYCEACYLTSVY